jgi:N-acetylglucosamine-6-sulfatase
VARFQYTPSRVRVPAGAALLVVLAALWGGLALTGSAPAQEDAAEGGGRPNFVVIMTDDQPASSLRHMPRLQRTLIDRGTRFTNSFASFPLCCPSRATFISGQYAHNSGVQGNNPRDNGGYELLKQPERNLAAWLAAGGYTTAHIGKFLSGYDTAAAAPGFTRWNGFFGSQTRYYDYRLVVGNDPRRFGLKRRDYSTTVMTGLARQAIRKLSNSADPFFLSLAYNAPHSGAGRDDAAGRRCGGVDPHPRAQPAPRDADAFAHAQVATAPSFNEKAIGDKPALIAGLHRFGDSQIKKIKTGARCRLAALRSVDRGVATIVRTLKRERQLSHTVILYTTDNGVFAGEHRINDGKNRPYEEAIAAPLIVRGPGVGRGKRVAVPVANVDLAPSILDLAGVSPPPSLARPLDGRSFAPALGGGHLGDRAILIEGRNSNLQSRGIVSYQGVRTRQYAYHEYFHRRSQVATRPLRSTSATGRGSAGSSTTFARTPISCATASTGPDPASGPSSRTLCASSTTARDPAAWSRSRSHVPKPSRR